MTNMQILSIMNIVCTYDHPSLLENMSMRRHTPSYIFESVDRGNPGKDMVITTTVNTKPANIQAQITFLDKRCTLKTRMITINLSKVMSINIYEDIREETVDITAIILHIAISLHQASTKT